MDMNPTLLRLIFSRAFLAFTVGLFLSCAARVAESQEALDRSVRPRVPAAQPARVPAVQARRLRNGMTVAVLEQHEVPLVSVAVVVDAPSLLDPDGKSGLASLTAAMLAEGAGGRTAEQLGDEFAALGSAVSPAGFTTATANLGRGLSLLADMLVRPSFPDEALARQKANRIASLKRDRERPAAVAGRLLARALYAGHPYERVPTEEGTAAITRDDVVGFHAAHYRPENVRMVVVGDVTPAAAVAELERAFGTWRGGAAGPRPAVPIVPGVARTTIFLHDRPGAPQSVIAVAQPGPARGSRDYFAVHLMNTVLGGAFSSRINLNLREAHGYSYGARSEFVYRPHPQRGEFAASASVAAAQTDSALVELLREVTELRSTRPVTADELDFAKASATRELPMESETVEQLARLAAQLVRNRLPVDYYDTFADRIAAVGLDQVRGAAVKYLDPSRLAIVVVGDRKTIEPALRAANVAPIVVVDENGNPALAAR